MIDDICLESQQRMDKSVAALKNHLSKIRAGRAHPSLLNQVQVEYYGSPVPLEQIASISAEDARTLKISPWEHDMIEVIEKAIITSDLGLNPTSAGAIIRVPLPPLTEQRRRDLIRVVKEEGEKAKVAVRHIRRDANQDLKDLSKEGEISKDDIKNGEHKIQQLTDNYIKTIDDTIAQKEQDLINI